MRPLSQWAYFGCGRHGLGHDLHVEGGVTIDRQLRDQLERFDGVFPPHPETAALLYQATLSRLPGLNCSVLAWWDRSADTRVASNSAIYAPSPTCSPESMIDGALQKWPWVFSRLPQSLTLWSRA